MSRSTPRRANQRRAYQRDPERPLVAGTIAVLDDQGRAVPAITGTGLVALGIVERSDHLLADTVEVLRGCALVDNSSGADEVTHAHIGQRCYLVDEHTVAATDGGGTRSAAGIVDGVDANGVWALIDPTSGVYLTASD